MFATAKILIWKQFTTVVWIVRYKFCCVCNCKDTNLKAIHNPQRAYWSYVRVVFATAKILIWKQFTTHYRLYCRTLSCVCNCKDTNLKAIHNTSSLKIYLKVVVFATAKILIWKQFTTNGRSKYIPIRLCLQLQRY